MVEHILPEGALIDMENSFYCGNRVGRKADNTDENNNADLSNTDLKFAAKLGIKLETP